MLHKEIHMHRHSSAVPCNAQAEPGSFVGLESAFQGKEPGYPGGERPCGIYVS